MDISSTVSLYNNTPSGRVPSDPPSFEIPMKNPHQHPYPLYKEICLTIPLKYENSKVLPEVLYLKICNRSVCKQQENSGKQQQVYLWIKKKILKNQSYSPYGYKTGWGYTWLTPRTQQLQLLENTQFVYSFPYICLLDLKKKSRVLNFKFLVLFKMIQWALASLSHVSCTFRSTKNLKICILISLGAHNSKPHH